MPVSTTCAFTAQTWYSVRDSNPCTQLERLASWPLDERNISYEIWRRRRESNPPESARQAVTLPECYDGINLVSRIGFEPMSADLRSRSPEPLDERDIYNEIWQDRRESNPRPSRS
jgi:hypothetical protein